MVIYISPNELEKKFGISWMHYCEITGANEWAISEGMDPNESLHLTEETATKLGIIHPMRTGETDGSD